jgi:hypothetical protein
VAGTYTRLGKTFLCLVVLLSAGAGADTLDESVSRLMEKIRSGGTVDDTAVRRAPAGDVYRVMRLYLQAGNNLVREKAIYAIADAAARAAKPDERAEGIDILMSQLTSGVPDNVRLAINRLVAIAKKKDFDEKQKSQIGDLLRGKSSSSDTVLLAGIAASESYIKLLKMIAESDRGEISRDARLALGRMGERDANLGFIREFASMRLLDKIRAMPHLAYLRTPEAVATLRDCLFSEDEIPSDGDMLGVKLSHAALEPLTQIIKDFPIEHRFHFTDNEVDDARIWMRRHPSTEVVD